MTNEQRAEELIGKLGFDFNKISKSYIAGLLQDEITFKTEVLNTYDYYAVIYIVWETFRMSR